jgi:putative transposase
MMGSLLTHLDDSTAKILNATISEEAGRWFLSFCVAIEREVKPARFPSAIVGVDLGVKSLAVLSTGQVIPNPRPMHRYSRKMARLNRELSRRQRGSRHRAETSRRLARLHRKARTCRADALHQLSGRLASTYGTAVIEDLNLAGMTRAPKAARRPNGGFARNRRGFKAGLNRAILHAAPAELRRKISYKLAWHGDRLFVANFPSSKRCSSCDAMKTKLSLSERTNRCCRCRVVIDRDLNPARNLAALGSNVAGRRR